MSSNFGKELSSQCTPRLSRIDQLETFLSRSDGEFHHWNFLTKTNPFKICYKSWYDIQGRSAEFLRGYETKRKLIKSGFCIIVTVASFSISVYGLLRVKALHVKVLIFAGASLTDCTGRKLFLVVFSKAPFHRRNIGAPVLETSRYKIKSQV